MPVDANGIGAATTLDSSFRAEGVHLHSDTATGYVYGDWGEVVDAANGIPVGNFRCRRPYGTYVPGALSVADPGLKRFYILVEVTLPGGCQRSKVRGSGHEWWLKTRIR